MCWFEGGVTRSGGPLEAIEGLGLLPGSLTVHADGEPERLPVWLAAVRERRAARRLGGRRRRRPAVPRHAHDARRRRRGPAPPRCASTRRRRAGAPPHRAGAARRRPRRTGVAAGARRRPRAARAAAGDAARLSCGVRCAHADRPPLRARSRTSRATARRSASGSRPGRPGRRQSVAEATVPAGGSTLAHFHRESEEIYLVTSGSGRMLLGNEERPIGPGDCVVIPPGRCTGCGPIPARRSSSSARACRPTRTRTRCWWTEPAASGSRRDLDGPVQEVAVQEPQHEVPGDLQPVRLVPIPRRRFALLVVRPAVELHDNACGRPQRVDLEAGGAGVEVRARKASGDDEVEEPLLQPRPGSTAPASMGIEGGAEARVTLTMATLGARQRPLDRHDLQQPSPIRLP